MSANLQAEFARLEQAVKRSAASRDVMNHLRRELGVLRDEDAVAKVQQLKDEAEAARAQVREIQGSFAWRLTHAFARR